MMLSAKAPLGKSTEDCPCTFLIFIRRGQGKDLECAIKKMELPENMALMSDREKQTLDAIRKEILALKMLKHPNIVRLHDVKRMNNVIFMVMELCNESVSLPPYIVPQRVS